MKHRLKHTHSLSRLKGFTLIEMLVSMALMGSVLMLGIFTYQTMLSYHQRHEQGLSHASELSLLSHSLNQDIRSSTQAFLMSPNALGFSDAHQQTIAIYECQPGKMIRITPHRPDTFAIAGVWTSGADGRIVLQDSAQLWQIPITLWPQAQAAMSQKIPNAVDIWFESGTNEDIPWP